jgi:hypothetical protein
MNLQKWLVMRTPLPPESLTAAIRQAVHLSQQSSSASIVQGAQSASLHLLRRSLERADDSRSEALHLLAADALMTYACEAACEDPPSLDQSAAEAMEAVVTLFRAALPARRGQ